MRLSSDQIVQNVAIADLARRYGWAVYNQWTFPTIDMAQPAMLVARERVVAVFLHAGKPRPGRERAFDQFVERTGIEAVVLDPKVPGSAEVFFASNVAPPPDGPARVTRVAARAAKATEKG